LLEEVIAVSQKYLARVLDNRVNYSELDNNPYPILVIVILQLHESVDVRLVCGVLWPMVYIRFLSQDTAYTKINMNMIMED
jgi:hypothetical protein